jgi:hypothetical protein
MSRCAWHARQGAWPVEPLSASDGTPGRAPSRHKKQTETKNLVIDKRCMGVQDEEDAKRGLYNWFAQSRRLLTLPRLLFGTATAVAVPYLALGLQDCLLVSGVTLGVSIAAGYYGTSILGAAVEKQMHT